MQIKILLSDDQKSMREGLRSILEKYPGYSRSNQILNPHMNYPPHDKTERFGLFSIRERLACLEGDCRIESAIGQVIPIIMVAPLRGE